MNQKKKDTEWENYFDLNWPIWNLDVPYQLQMI